MLFIAPVSRVWDLFYGSCLFVALAIVFIVSAMMWDSCLAQGDPLVLLLTKSLKQGLNNDHSSMWAIFHQSAKIENSQLVAAGLEPQDLGLTTSAH